MPHPKAGYYLDGVKIPGVTSILSRFKDSGGLIHWAWKEGKEGRDYRDTSKAAADSGKLCHAMIEADMHKHFVDLNDFPGLTLKTRENALHAFKAYRAWKKRVAWSDFQTELSLVSKRHRFGGTLDAAMVTDKLVLADWKTSGAIYTDMLVQVAGGYSLLWQEHFPEDPIEGIEILRVSKPENPGDPISFHDHYWGPQVIEHAQRQFLLLREAYDLDRKLKGLL